MMCMILLFRDVLLDLEVFCLRWLVRAPRGG
jgi:hypothetical protein